MDNADQIPALTWSAPVHPVHERDKRWYVLATIALVALMAYGIFTGAWTFALVLVLLGGMYFLLHKAPDVIQTIQLTEHGFYFGSLFTTWNDCKGFWFVHTPLYTELHFIVRRGWNREPVIQLADGINEHDIRSILSHKVLELSDRGEHLVDRFIRICKL